MADSVSLVANILEHEIVTVGDIQWTEGMTLLSTMEAARDKDPGFSFTVGYYSKDLGYLLFEVNHVGDQPCVYWDVGVNGKPPKSGLDKDPVNAGDVVTLTFAWCGPDQARESPQIAAKFEWERQNPALQVQV